MRIVSQIIASTGFIRCIQQLRKRNDPDIERGKMSKGTKRKIDEANLDSFVNTELNVENRLAVVEGKVDKIQDHLHLLVDTIRLILKRLNNNLRYNEKMTISDDNDDDNDDDDDDDEFDLSDYDEQVELEVRRIRQNGKQ